MPFDMLLNSENASAKLCQSLYSYINDFPSLGKFIYIYINIHVFSYIAPHLNMKVSNSLGDLHYLTGPLGPRPASEESLPQIIINSSRTLWQQQNQTQKDVIAKNGMFRVFNLNHQEFQVPKMEALNLIRLFKGWAFPYISLTYSLYRWVPPF